MSTSINIVKDLSLSPSFTYNGVAYLSSIRKGDWVADSTMPGGGLYPCRYGIWPALRPQLQRKSVSFFTTRRFTVCINSYRLAKSFAIRHVIRPSASVSYTPKIGVPKSKYWKTYTDSQGNDQEYSIFDNKLYGTPSGAEESGEPEPEPRQQPGNESPERQRYHRQGRV